tara:strand:- start:451 stop:1056 length:606 start_codon:yes stop_codon:yes gene_type:complete
MIKGVLNGEVELYYNGSKKLNTKSNGITVIGDIGFANAGSGIDFGANSHASGMSSEFFDSYEEGTFTPTYGYNGSSQSGFSTSSNYGRYTKVGRLVHIQWWTNFSATPDNGNTVQMELPFASANDSGYRGGIPFSWSNITWAGQSSTVQGGRTHMNYNTTFMELGFRSNVNGGGWSASGILCNSMANDASFQGEGVYMTNT